MPGIDMDKASQQITAAAQQFELALRKAGLTDRQIADVVAAMQTYVAAVGQACVASVVN